MPFNKVPRCICDLQSWAAIVQQLVMPGRLDRSSLEHQPRTHGPSLYNRCKACTPCTHKGCGMYIMAYIALLHFDSL